MTVTNTARRLALVGLLALVAALMPLQASAQVPGLDGPTQLDLDLAADTDDAVETSLLFSNLQFPSDTLTDTVVPPVTDVILATSEDGADALSSGSIADNSPLLYVDPSVGITDDHQDEFDRLGTQRVIIIGETDAIPASVEAQLNDYDILRLGGATRIETANEVANFLYCRNDATNESGDCDDTPNSTIFVPGVDTDTDTDVLGDTANDTAVHLSRAFGTATNTMTAFADAAGLGAWAAQSGVATVLTDIDTVTDSTREFYEDTSNDTVVTTVAIGGVNAVSDTVTDTLAADYDQDVDTRVFQPLNDVRAGTAIAVNEARGLGSDSDTLEGVVFVDGYADGFFIDAYALAGLAGNSNYAVVLTNGDDLTPETVEYLDAIDGLGDLDLITTPNVSDAAVDLIESASGATLAPTTIDDL